MITINNIDYISVTYASFLSNDFNCLKKFDLSILEKKNYAFLKKNKDNYIIANSVGLKTNTINLYFVKNWLEDYLNEEIHINQKYLDLIKLSKCKCEKRRSTCKHCNGAQICIHGKHRYRCNECKEGFICEHERNKNTCRRCKGNRICIHEKQRQNCGKCKGSQICITPLCETRKHKKYDNFCAFCFFSNPENANHPRMINYKTKERSTVEFIIETFSEITWISDKKILDGCSGKRPDLFADFGDHIIIIEIDEDKHFDYTCENKRICQLSQDVNMRPITFIRFNPDSYEINDNKIKSPWKKDKFGKLKLINQQEWDIRLKILKNTVLEVINQPSYKIINVLQLFF